MSSFIFLLIRVHAEFKLYNMTTVLRIFDVGLLTLLHIRQTVCVKTSYYMASSVSGQDEPNRAL